MDDLRLAKDFIEAIQEKGILLNKTPIDKRLMAVMNFTDIGNGFAVLNEECFQKDWIDFLNFLVDRKDDESFNMTFPVMAHVSSHKNGFFMGAYGGQIARIATATWDNKTAEITIPHGVDKFFSRISGLAILALLRCPHCGKVFLNISNRKMIYCSSNCRTYASIKRTKKD